MSEPPVDPSTRAFGAADRDERLGAILASYVEAVDAGRLPDREALLAANPDLADELREFFANWDQMEQAMGAVRREPHHHLPKLRYFGDYELLEEIARGGMGVVYKARQVSLNRVVAVKMILAGQLATVEDVRRFRTEAEAAANLQHPNIVAVHEVGVHEDQHYFSMDFVEGQNLGAVVRDNPLPAEVAAAHVETIARAVHYAHQQGTLHRDLKPSNVLIDTRNQVRITDFGLAARLGGEDTLTKTGQILGTPSYMAPEQAGGKRALIGPAADIYSLGVILYELVTGRPPFRAESTVETLQQVLHAEPASPRLLNPHIPRDLDTICLKCLQKEPHKRYGTADLLADDLGRYLRGEPILARPISRWERGIKWIRRHPSAAALIFISAVALLSTVAAGVGVLYNRRLDAVNRELIVTKNGLEQSNQQLTVARDGLERSNQELIGAKDRLEQSNQELTGAKERLEQSNQELGVSNTQLADAQKKLDAALQTAETEKLNARRYLYASQMTLVERAREAGDIGRVVQLLRSVVPTSPDEEDLRGFEWHHLWRMYHGEESRLRGHTGPVTAIAFSPNDRLLASGSADKTVRIWDTVTHQTVLTLRGHEGRVTGLAFSPDGKRLVSGGTDAKVLLWDTNTGQSLHSFAGHQGPVHCVAFDPKGLRIASGSEDTTVRIWNASTFKTIVAFTAHKHPVFGVAFSPDGGTMASGSMGGGLHPTGELEIWETATGKSVMTVTGRACSSVAFSPDGKFVAIGGCRRTPEGKKNNVVELLDVTSGQVGATFEGHSHSITQVAYRPDGKWVVSASADQTLKIWDVNAEKEHISLREEVGATCVTYSHDSQKIASGCDDQTIKIWIPPGTDARAIKYQRRVKFNNVAFNSDGTRVAASTNGSAIVWDTATCVQLLWTRMNSPGVLGRIAWHPDDKHVAVGRSLLEIATEAVTSLPLNGAVEATEGISVGYGTDISHDGRLLATDLSTDHIKNVGVWDLNTKRCIQVIRPGTAWTFCVAFSPDSKLLAVGGSTHKYPKLGSLQVWNIETGELVHTLEGFRDTIVSVDFSPDGRRIAAAVTVTQPGDVRGTAPDEGGATPAEVRVWDAATGREIYNLRGYRSRIYSVAFSPDGKRLASAGGPWYSKPDFGEIKIWDMQTGLQVGAMPDHSSTVYGVAFSPCGRVLAAATNDGFLKLYDGTPVSLDEIR